MHRNFLPGEWSRITSGSSTCRRLRMRERIKKKFHKNKNGSICVPVAKVRCGHIFAQRKITRDPMHDNRQTMTSFPPRSWQTVRLAGSFPGDYQKTGFTGFSGRILKRLPGNGSRTGRIFMPDRAGDYQGKLRTRITYGYRSSNSASYFSG